MEEVSCAGDDVMQLGWMETSHVGFSCRADGSAEMKESRVTTHAIHGRRRSSFATDENGPGNVAGSRVTLPGKEGTNERRKRNEREGKRRKKRASEGAPGAQRGRESERGRSADDEEARHEEVARSLAFLVRSRLKIRCQYYCRLLVR
jgi:hypothetical protein